jgi:hypothetical protein
MKKLLLTGLVMSLVLVSCRFEGDRDKKAGIPGGLYPAGVGAGPQVRFEPDRAPFPDTPFPNDYFSVPDETKVTGIRANIPTASTTRVEGRIRENLLDLDGFGAYSPIWVSFDAPLDLVTVTDDSALLIKLDGPNAGECAPLDLGKGHAPIITTNQVYWPHDPLANANNKIMDPNNKMDLDNDGTPEFIDFYEFETNSLIMRPVIPLDEASRYAVVLLKDITGIGGRPIRSAFPYINEPRPAYPKRDTPSSGRLLLELHHPVHFQ